MECYSALFPSEIWLTWKTPVSGKAQFKRRCRACSPALAQLPHSKKMQRYYKKYSFIGVQNVSNGKEFSDIPSKYNFPKSRMTGEKHHLYFILQRDTSPFQYLLQRRNKIHPGTV
jgi:hypothetical protein